MVISIGKKNGWVHENMTMEQALDITFLQISRKAKESHIEEPISIVERKETVSVDLEKPIYIEIHIRLCLEDWKQIVEKARRLHTSPTSLAHEWILDGLAKNKT